MNIVIPLCKKSKANDDWEIRYCLRSIEKYVQSPRVILVGYKPDFIDNVLHLPLGDPYVVNKDANIINKILYACHHIGRDFIRLSDDQYFIKPYEPKIYNCGELKSHKGEGANWHKTAFETWDLLKQKGLPTLNYDCHCPQLMSKKDYVKIMFNCQWAQGANGILVNSFYFNSLGEKSSLAKVARYKHPQESYDFGDNDFLNHNDSGLTEGLKKKIMEFLPEKSRYEI